MGAPQLASDVRRRVLRDAAVRSGSFVVVFGAIETAHGRVAPRDIPWFLLLFAALFLLDAVELASRNSRGRTLMARVVWGIVLAGFLYAYGSSLP